LYEELKEYMWLNNFKLLENPKKYRLTVSLEDENHEKDDNEDQVIIM
jgi:hypothetical protein